MPSLFDKLYRFAKGTVLSPDQLNLRFQSIDSRFLPLEDKRVNEETIFASVSDNVLARSEAVIASLRARLVAITSLEWLVSRSGTPLQLVTGTVQSLVVDEDDRPLFTPGPFSILTRAGSVDDYAVVRLVRFDRAGGQFDFEVEAIAGDPGPHDDWVIAAVAGSTIAQLAMLDQAQAIRDTIVPQVQAAASTSADAKTATAAALAAALDAKAIAIAQAAAAKASADLASTFDPTTYQRTQFPVTRFSAADGNLVAGQTVLTLPAVFTNGSVRVFVNTGKLVAGIDYAQDGPNKRVTLAAGLDVGDVVEVEAFIVNGVLDTAPLHHTHGNEDLPGVAAAIEVEASARRTLEFYGSFYGGR